MRSTFKILFYINRGKVKKTAQPPYFAVLLLMANKP